MVVDLMQIMQFFVIVDGDLYWMVVVGVEIVVKELRSDLVFYCLDQWMLQVVVGMVFQVDEFWIKLFQVEWFVVNGWIVGMCQYVVVVGEVEWQLVVRVMQGYC